MSKYIFIGVLILKHVIFDIFYDLINRNRLLSYVNHSFRRCLAASKQWRLLRRTESLCHKWHIDA